MQTTNYKLRIEFTEPVLGTQPQKDIATEFIQNKAREQGLDVTDEQETLATLLEKGQTVFHRVPGGSHDAIYYDYHVRGFLKESGRVQNGLDGVKALRSKVTQSVFIFPRQIVLNVPKDAPIEFLERP